mgnify:CR=1 FL=1
MQKHAISASEVWAQPGHDRFPALRSAPDAAAVQEAVERLRAARAPVLVVGGGVILSGACGELAASTYAPSSTSRRATSRALRSRGYTVVVASEEQKLGAGASQRGASTSTSKATSPE